ncbi:coiled-coil domain-containing protein 183 [Athene cunicularia]|uniref:coiled-coil domain-containing protein 183 n=1 Tax=Athene cunicularia TaxID=194338 RepID=UPI000EF683C8|nr:coiled-coil domain-containing protein 183 [Athene cunicularia]
MGRRAGISPAHPAIACSVTDYDLTCSVPRQQFPGAGSWAPPVATARAVSSARGAAMDATRAAGPKGRGRSTSSVPGRKAKLSQHAQELRTIIALQEEDRESFTWSCGEEVRQKRERLPPLCETVRDARAASDAQKLDQPPRSKASQIPSCQGSDDVLEQRPGICSSTSVQFSRQDPCPARRCPASPASGLANAPMSMQVTQEKLRAEIHARVNTCNLLLDQVRQRSQVRDELQRRLQRLQAVEKEDKQHQAQLQAIRQLENSIEKMLLKVQAAQKVTALYVEVRDALRKELDQLPMHLDLLCGTAERYHRQLEDAELVAADARRDAAVTKGDVKKLKAQLRADREFRCRSKAALERQVKESFIWHLREQARQKLAVDLLNMQLQDSIEGTQVEDTESQEEYKAWVTKKMEEAKAAVPCSHVWDMAGRFLEQQKASADLERYLQQCKEKQQALKETLHQLELKHNELKLRQPPNTFSCVDVNVSGCRKLEEELRRELQREEARREQMRAQMLKEEDLLLQFENAVNNLVVLLRGITVPGQDASVQARDAQEKLQHCRQKLQYLVQRTASLPPDSHSLNEDNKAFVKVRNLLEQSMAEDPRNPKISLEDTEGRRAQRGHVPQRLSQPLPTGSSERPRLSPTVPADPDPGAASRPWLQTFVGSPSSVGGGPQRWHPQALHVTLGRWAGRARHSACARGPGTGLSGMPPALQNGHITPGTQAQQRWPRRPSPTCSSLLSPPDPPASDDEDDDHVLCREDIKKQGLLLIEAKKKRLVHALMLWAPPTTPSARDAPDHSLSQ